MKRTRDYGVLCYAMSPYWLALKRYCRYGTGKRARKRTGIANAHQLEPTPEPEPVSQLAQIIASPETWRAPAAKMY